MRMVLRSTSQQIWLPTKETKTGAGEWFRELRDLAWMPLSYLTQHFMVICLTEAPGLEVHVSTQASTTNYEAFAFWEEIGVSRVVLGALKSELLKLKKFVNTPHLKLKLSFTAQCVSVIQGVVSFLII